MFAHPKYALCSRRLRTFGVRPLENRLSAVKVIDAGFFYINMNDCTVCVYCGNVESGWGATDDPLQRHPKGYPECCNKRQSASLCSEFITAAHPRFSGYDARHRTFQN